MLAKVRSFGLLGLETYPIDIEVDISNGLPITRLVGLADTSIQESKERVKSAIKNQGFCWPEGKITISLAPSSIRKDDTGKQGFIRIIYPLKVIFNLDSTIEKHPHHLNQVIDQVPLLLLIGLSPGRLKLFIEFAL
jgi:hypothetical protein